MRGYKLNTKGNAQPARNTEPTKTKSLEREDLKILNV